MAPPDFQLIETQKELEVFCRGLKNQEWIAFDTEFVSEDRYQPELCLLQVAAGEQIAIIDPIRIGNNLELFWELLVDGDHVTIAHAGREEFRFCYRFAEGWPNRFFDIQMAAGLIGLEYPAAYSTLVSKLAGKTLEKGETRTDWRRRPLSKPQLSYAASDVIYLEKIYRKISRKLEKLDRKTWFDEEMRSWQQDVENSMNGEHLWRRVSGVATLDRKSLAVARELWHWREDVAAERDQPARRILRDDLLVELARRGTSSQGKIKAVRGMERRQYHRYLDELSDTIERANQLPKNELPKREFGTRTPQLGQLGQFLTTAMGIICRQQNIAPGIFGTTNELRQLAAWKLGMTSKPETRLTEGWRGEMIMPMIDGLLEGRVGMRVRKASAAEPLELLDLDSDD